MPDSAGLCTPMEQLQLGGGSVAPLGYLDPVPGLTFYGGNPWEGLPIYRDSTDTAHIDWRFINFNYYHNPWTGTPSRFARMASSGIGFSQVAGGLVQLQAQPYNPGLGQNDFTHYTVFQITGQQGLSMYTYIDSLDPYHHLFDVYPPGYLPYGVSRNKSGLCYHNTPVFIGFDTVGNPLADFTNLINVRPDIGDDTTWMLVVNGPELAKEIFVLDSNWADYVFDPGYKLPPLGEVENYIKANHHLSDIEPASKIAKTGVPVGRTEEALTKKVEELTLYVIDQNKKIEDQNKKIDHLEADIQKLINQKEK
jgi:hypothetical protein